MKVKTIVAGILTTVALTGCGVNDDGVNNTAYRNRDMTELTRVNYAPQYGYTGYDNYNDLNLRGTDLTPVRNNTGINMNTSDGINGVNQSRMRVADKAADRIVSLPEVDHANVIVTNDNAYVAARLVDNRNGLSRDIERKIARQVKSVDRDINDVYVSVNPDFYDRMTNYSNDIRNGRPVEGFFDEFTNSVRRVFPTHFNE